MKPEVNPLDIAWVGSPPATGSDFGACVRARFPYYETNYSRWLPARQDAEILDYGFGDGAMLLFLHDRGYTNLSGVDLDPRFAAFGKEHLPARIEHAADPLAFLQAHRDRYDLVVALHVAYYVPRDRAAEWFSSLAQTLRPGGRLLVEAFNGAVSSAALIVANDPYIRNAFSEHSLRWVLEIAGLDVVHLGNETYQRAGLSRATWLLGRRALNTVRRVKFVLDRGRDTLNPTLLGKQLIAVADRPRRDQGAS